VHIYVIDRSYDERMGTVLVNVKGPLGDRTMIIDAYNPSVHESVFATQVMEGLTGQELPGGDFELSKWELFIEVIDRDSSLISQSFVSQGSEVGGDAGSGGGDDDANAPDPPAVISSYRKKRMLRHDSNAMSNHSSSIHFEEEVEVESRRRRRMTFKKDPSACLGNKFKLLLVACS
jgi:hypothetical protein